MMVKFKYYDFHNLYYEIMIYFLIKHFFIEYEVMFISVLFCDF